MLQDYIGNVGVRLLDRTNSFLLKAVIIYPFRIASQALNTIRQIKDSDRFRRHWIEVRDLLSRSCDGVVDLAHRYIGDHPVWRLILFAPIAFVALLTLAWIAVYIQDGIQWCNTGHFHDQLGLFSYFYKPQEPYHDQHNPFHDPRPLEEPYPWYMTEPNPRMRTTFTDVTTVYGWLADGDMVVREDTTPFELDLLNLPRLEAVPRIDDVQEENAFAKRVELLGGRRYKLRSEDSARICSRDDWYDAQSRRESVYTFDIYQARLRVWIGWPDGLLNGGVWVLIMSRRGEHLRSTARLKNAQSLEDHCAMIKALGGRYYETYDEAKPLIDRALNWTWDRRKMQPRLQDDTDLYSMLSTAGEPNRTQILEPMCYDYEPDPEEYDDF